MPLKVWPGTN